MYFHFINAFTVSMEWKHMWKEASCTIPGLYLCSGALLEYLSMIWNKLCIYIYLILTLYAAPQFSLCLKQAVLAPVSLRPPSRWAHCILIGQRIRRLGKVTFFSRSLLKMETSEIHPYILVPESDLKYDPNNLSNKGYWADGHLWACANNLPSSRGKGRQNFANEAFRAGWCPGFWLAGSKEGTFWNFYNVYNRKPQNTHMSPLKGQLFHCWSLKSWWIVFHCDMLHSLNLNHNKEKVGPDPKLFG